LVSFPEFNWYPEAAEAPSPERTPAALLSTAETMLHVAIVVNGSEVLKYWLRSRKVKDRIA
jgi:hypothetical protein